LQNKSLKWAAPLVLFGIVLAFSLSFYYRAPYHDHWDLVPHYQKLEEGQFQWSDLFELHGNHWHASGLFIKLLLAKLTGMGHWAESLGSVLIAGLGFLALARILSRTLEHWDVTGRRTVVWVFGLAALFYFSLDQAGNWLWGWQISVFINLAGALWMVERLTAGPPRVSNTVLAAIAAALAIYAFATGWALIPIGLALLVLSGAHRTWTGRTALLIWIGLAVLIFIHYGVAISARELDGVQSGLPRGTDLSTMLGLVHYSINFLASPVVRFARDVSVPIFFLGIGLLAWSVWEFYKLDHTRLWQGIAPILALAAYSGGAAILTALGRWESYGVKQAFVSRYISFGSFFWIAVFVLVVIAMASRKSRSHRTQIGVLGLLFVLKIGNMPSVVQKTVSLSSDIRASSVIIAAHYPDVDPADYAILHAQGQVIDPQLEILHAHHVSFLYETTESPRD